MGVFVYRDMTLRRFVDAVISAGCSTGVVMLVIMGSSVVGWLVTYAQIPQAFAAWCMETLQDPWLIILAMNVIMLIVGMFIDLPAAILLMGPMRSEEHTSELQSLMRLSYTDFCLKQ